MLKTEVHLVGDVCFYTTILSYQIRHVCYNVDNLSLEKMLFLCLGSDQTHFSVVSTLCLKTCQELL